MKSELAFWDASAAALLCVHQPARSAARRLHRKFQLVVWWGTRIEIRGVLARLERDAHVTSAGAAAAKDVLEALARSWREVLPTDRVRRLACSILDSHPLRSADAVQLAAALVWSNEKPKKRTFICHDSRLATAAANEGFTIEIPS